MKDSTFRDGHVCEEEPRMAEFEVLQQREQLEAVEGAPGNNDDDFDGDDNGMMMVLIMMMMLMRED